MPAIQMKAEYSIKYSVLSCGFVYFAVQKVSLTFKNMDKIVKCNHSNRIVLSAASGVVYIVLQDVTGVTVDYIACMPIRTRF